MGWVTDGWKSSGAVGLIEVGVQWEAETPIVSPQHQAVSLWWQHIDERLHGDWQQGTAGE